MNVAYSTIHLHIFAILFVVQRSYYLNFSKWTFKFISICRYNLYMVPQLSNWVFECKSNFGSPMSSFLHKIISNCDNLTVSKKMYSLQIIFQLVRHCVYIVIDVDIIFSLNDLHLNVLYSSVIIYIKYVLRYCFYTFFLEEVILPFTVSVELTGYIAKLYYCLNINYIIIS